MKIHEFEQDGIHYDFEPPIEVGAIRVKTIHELAAIALIGPGASNEEVVASMHDFTQTLRSEGLERVAALNTFLVDRHVVTGARTGAGMPAWSSATPWLGKIPGGDLSPARKAHLRAGLDEINRAEMAVRGNDLIVYPPRL